MRRATSFASVAVAVLVLLAGGRGALPFHGSGSGDCESCHIQHKSEDGTSPVVSRWLLRHDNPTDLCLSCHATQLGAVMSADPLNPSPEKGGGNFIFLMEENLNDGDDGFMNLIDGSHAGHNVVSSTWGLFPDPQYTTSPGGSYLSSELGCTSCHDPHGNGNYRSLYGAGATVTGGYVFSKPGPKARGLPLRSPGETRANHVAYQDGWTQWCSNCHGFYHQDSLMGFKHPVDEPLGDSERNSYNTYSGETNPTGGNPTTAYLPEVPFQDTGATTTSTFGPTMASRISCMSCHRAHGTSAPHAGRWDFNVRLLDDDGLVSGSYSIPNPYPGPDQRQLCLKCHYQEARNHGMGRACIECHGQ